MCFVRFRVSKWMEMISWVLPSTRGAAVIISEKPNPAEFPVTWLQVRDARKAMGIAASNLEGHPSMEMPIVGVTGTNGKTTTTYLIHFLLESILRRAGLIGTIQYSNGDGIVDAPHTTPESPDLHRLLREMRDNDCRGAAIEVSSHGLSQKRVEGVAFDVGVFAEPDPGSSRLSRDDGGLLRGEANSL
jgi:UDP-N-acetylmuramoyl-L-alanyl-D-glutamate--2,6-diaminopimelate ligase